MTISAKGLTALAAAVLSANVALAADSDYAGLEEVVVTAQKRESTLQDTPVAVSAVSGEGLKDRGLDNIQDLELAVPSLNTTQSATASSQTFSIRGLGTSSFNAGLEPSVGVFIDGVYRSRAGSAIGDFIAVERVEVLRGPQSTVFGKNTPAGVISIITKKPDYEFGFDLEQSFGNFDSHVTRGTITGPINDTVAYRVSGNYNQRDGFLDNLAPGKGDVNDRDRYDIRGQLLIEPTDELTIRIIADSSSIEEDCCAAPFIFNSEENAKATRDIGGTVLPTDLYSGDIQFDGLLSTDQEQSGISVQIDWEADNYSFTSLTAYRDFSEENNIDADFTDTRTNGERFEDTDRQVLTQEFRIQSIGENNIDWMVGYYYYDSDQTFAQRTPYGPQLRAFADSKTKGLLGAIETIPGIPVQNSAPVINPVFGQFSFNDFLAEGDGLIRSDFDLGTTSHSVFGKVDWHVTEQLSVSLGARWTTEDKDVDAQVLIRDDYSALDLRDGEALDLFVRAASGGEATAADLRALQFNKPTEGFKDDRTESETTGALIVSYEFNDDISLYASANRGHKAGGYNVSADAANSSIDFGKELADSFEVGAKVHLLDNRAQLNLAAFSQRLRDFQTNAFNGTGFTLVNAGKVEIDGLEFEALYAPTANLLISFAGTYLDAEYASFVEGPAIAGSDGDFQDLSGGDVSGVPEWTFSSSVSYTRNLGPVEGFVNVAARYRGSRNVLGSAAPIGDQDAYTVTNATVGIRDLEGLWTVSLWSNNLFDEEYTDIIFDSVGAAGSYNAYPGDPRTYGVTLRVQY